MKKIKLNLEEFIEYGVKKVKITCNNTNYLMRLVNKLKTIYDVILDDNTAIVSPHLTYTVDIDSIKKYVEETTDDFINLKKETITFYF